MKLCKDCKHQRPRVINTFILLGIFGVKTAGKYSKCAYPDREPRMDMVTGKVEKQSLEDMTFCSTERHFEGDEYCGASAKHFEAKQ